jgi:hypothetical protein
MNIPWWQERIDALMPLLRGLVAGFSVALLGIPCLALGAQTQTTAWAGVCWTMLSIASIIAWFRVDFEYYSTSYLLCLLFVSASLCLECGWLVMTIIVNHLSGPIGPIHISGIS